LGWQNLVGDTTPDNLYPTEVYTINGDFWADYANAASNGQELHDAYLGLTSAEIDSATQVVDGLTTYYDIPTLTSPELFEALLRAFSAL
jgi:hypothetical protein